jgi:tetratricopeptide (TPR) repeat protein
MTSGPARHTTPIVLLVVLSIPLNLFSQARDTAVQPRALDPQLERNLRLASDYHELAKLYLKKGEPDKAVAEIRKVLQLRFPDEYEQLVVQSIAYVSDKLGEMRRFEIAQALLDEALKSIEQPGNQAKVFKTKARLFLASGDDDKAIESYKRALELGEIAK